MGVVNMKRNRKSTTYLTREIETVNLVDSIQKTNEILKNDVKRRLKRTLIAMIPLSILIIGAVTGNVPLAVSGGIPLFVMIIKISEDDMRHSIADEINGAFNNRVEEKDVLREEHVQAREQAKNEPNEPHLTLVGDSPEYNEAINDLFDHINDYCTAYQIDYTDLSPREWNIIFSTVINYYDGDVDMFYEYVNYVIRYTFARTLKEGKKVVGINEVITTLNALQSNKALNQELAGKLSESKIIDLAKYRERMKQK